MTKQPPDIIQALYHHLKQFIETKTDKRLKLEQTTRISITDKYTNFVLIYILYHYEYKAYIYHPTTDWGIVKTDSQTDLAHKKNEGPLRSLEFTDPQLIDTLEQAILEYSRSQHNAIPIAK
jgi:hypothetical protein